MYYRHQSNKKQTEKSFEKVRIEVELKDILLNHFYKRDDQLVMQISRSVGRAGIYRILCLFCQKAEEDEVEARSDQNSIRAQAA